MPRRGAPQALQGPGCDEKVLSDPDTAKVESSFSTCELSHCLQVTEAALAELTILSNFVPQSRHWYSKIGIRTSVLHYIENLICCSTRSLGRPEI
jgi:hypothetical protein